MEAAIQTVVKVFVKSSKGKETLGNKEFQNLVKSQFSNILSGADSKEAINDMTKGLDNNHDGKVGFEEYMKLVGYLACSLSEQRTVAKEEPEQNAATGQVAQNAPNNKEEQPKENADAKEEAKPEAKAETKVAVKEEAKAEETKPEAANADAAAAKVAAASAEVAAASAEAAAASTETAAASTKVAAAVEVKVGEKDAKEVEEAAEKSPAAAEEEEKKTEEATS